MSKIKATKEELEAAVPPSYSELEKRIEELEADLQCSIDANCSLILQRDKLESSIEAGLKLKRYDICSAAGMHFPLENDHGEWVKAKQLREALAPKSDTK